MNPIRHPFVCLAVVLAIGIALLSTAVRGAAGQLWSTRHAHERHGDHRRGRMNEVLAYRLYRDRGRFADGEGARSGHLPRLAKIFVE